MFTDTFSLTGVIVKGLTMCMWRCAWNWMWQRKAGR
jgi:hypothetical protein